MNVYFITKTTDYGDTKKSKVHLISGYHTFCGIFLDDKKAVKTKEKITCKTCRRLTMPPAKAA